MCLFCIDASFRVCLDCCIRLLLTPIATAILQNINIQKNQQLLVNFFSSAVDLLQPGEWLRPSPAPTAVSPLTRCCLASRDPMQWHRAHE